MSRHKSSCAVTEMCSQGTQTYIRGFFSCCRRPVLVGTIFFTCALSSPFTGFGPCQTSWRCCLKSGFGEWCAGLGCAGVRSQQKGLEAPWLLLSLPKPYLRSRFIAVWNVLYLMISNVHVKTTLFYYIQNANVFQCSLAILPEICECVVVLAD